MRLLHEAGNGTVLFGIAGVLPPAAEPFVGA